jgi:hypothetical protein
MTVAVKTMTHTRKAITPISMQSKGYSWCPLLLPDSRRQLSNDEEVGVEAGAGLEGGDRELRLKDMLAQARDRTGGHERDGVVTVVMIGVGIVDACNEEVNDGEENESDGDDDMIMIVTSIT